MTAARAVPSPSSSASSQVAAATPATVSTEFVFPPLPPSLALSPPVLSPAAAMPSSIPAVAPLTERRNSHVVAPLWDGPDGFAQ